MLSVQMDPFGVFIEVYNRLTSPKPPYKVGKNNLENSRVLMTLSRSFWKRLGPSGARAGLLEASVRARAFARVREPSRPLAILLEPSRGSRMLLYALRALRVRFRARPLVCLPPLRARAPMS